MIDKVTYFIGFADSSIRFADVSRGEIINQYDGNIIISVLVLTSYNYLVKSEIDFNLLPIVF
jgi:hypothetical protein